MFVSKSKYREAVNRAAMFEAQVKAHAQKWNDLVRQINQKGGQQFLDHGVYPPPPSQFTQDEIQKLIMLCHPDKHNGKPMAVELTQKLLKLKG